MANGGLDVRNLSVTYPSKPPRLAVNEASFQLPVGGSLAIVGASGSGKSSLLAAIAGTTASKGAVSWGGVDLSTLPPHQRGVGLVFQDGQLFPHLDVAANVGFGLRMRRAGATEIERRVERLLDLVGLAGMQRRSVNELSGGERQRVALARTLAPSPPLVLLDEPLSALDADLRSRLASDLKEVLELEGSTWIVVTHDPQEAMTMAQSLAHMAQGRLSLAP